MPNVSTANIAERAHKVGIITLDQLRECWDELGSRNAAPDELVRLLQRKSFLTPFQIDKLTKGETSGYFYGGNKVRTKSPRAASRASIAESTSIPANPPQSRF
jgi:hypothetical protein